MTPEEEDVVLLELRTHGATVTVGGSRCHTDYSWRAGEGFIAMPFDEGHTEEYPCSEDQLRRVMRADPEPFRAVLKHPHLRALRAAWTAGDHPAARAHLARMRAERAATGASDDERLAAGQSEARTLCAISDGLDEGAVLDAVLAETPAAAEVLDLIREKVEGQTAWHVYMGLLAGWQRTAEVAAGGLWFTERLVALVGESAGTERLRSQFQAMAASAG